jgi:hypothetical protein
MRLRLLVFAALFATSCAGDSGQSLPTAPSGASDPRPLVGLSSPRAIAELAEDSVAPESNDLDFHELDVAAAATFTLSGKVTDKAVAAWAVANATVTITPGVPATKTNAQGVYTVKLSARTYTIKIAAAGYTASSVTKPLKGTSILNVALNPIKPPGATARCKDRTWSFSKNRSGTCSSHKGVQYWVCPGLLCEPPPPPPPPPPAGCGPQSAPCGAATAVCKDGTLSCSKNRSGTCSHHGGVMCWICPGPLCSAADGAAVNRSSREAPLGPSN